MASGNGNPRPVRGSQLHLTIGRLLRADMAERRLARDTQRAGVSGSAEHPGQLAPAADAELR